MASIDNMQLPTSVEEVEALILQLYQPGAPGEVANTQETLQRLQRSPQGWQLANSLLSHKNEQIRFFAALTFTVKLNTDAKSLSGEDAGALLQTLIGWLIQSMQRSEGALVVRKLCSTLVAYFMQFPGSWTHCVKHLMYCLCANETILYAAIEEAPGTSILVQSLSDEKAVAVFWFATTLVEEVGKTDSTSMKQNQFHKQVIPNVHDITPLISKFIGNDAAAAAGKIRQEAMKCFQAWVSYSHRAFIDNEIVLDPLRELTKPALRCLLDEELYEPTAELFSDILTNYSTFLDKEDFKLLQTLFNSSWAEERYSRLVQGDFDFDSLQFGMFMIAFGDATVQDLTKNIETDPQCSQFLSALAGLLGANGFVAHEDKIYVPALEFWNTFVENMVDETYSQEDGIRPSWFQPAQAHVMTVIQRCWRKSQFPSANDFNSWDSVDRTGFKDARRDFSDLLQQFYLTIGIPLLQMFIELIHKSVPTKNWAELEASMYCLSWLNDSIADEAERDAYLDKVFMPSFISVYKTQTEVPTRAMKAFLDLVIAYADYFEKRPAQLPAVLNIVFEATSALALAKTASRAISKLCSDCREILLPELGAFLQHYSNISSNYSLDASVKEAVMEGIASIIEAIKVDESRITPLEQLLAYVQVDVEKCVKLVGAMKQFNLGSDSAPLDIGLVALKCLKGIAKGIQAPPDKPVDLESTRISTFWTTGEGSHVQQQIYSMMCQVYDALWNHGDIVDEVCDIWRIGFREMEPGLFVMPLSMAVQFLTKGQPQTPRLCRVINTACFLVNSQRWDNGVEEALNTLLGWVTQLLHHFEAPGNDPEVAQAGLEFLQRLGHKYPQVLLGVEPPSLLEYLFMFALKALAGSDPLPKAASAEFWATFIGLSAQTQPLQSLIDNAVQHTGPFLAQALIYNIGGHAARSELDKLSEPVKKLVVRQINSKRWFEAALFDDNFPSDKVTVEDKKIFLQKIVHLRGAKGTNQVLRDFWLLCRGSNFAYVS